jgi:hypothetical protein
MMDLYPWERDYYVQYIELDPPIVGSTWEASFDGGATWKTGVSTMVEVDGVEVEAWAWLVAGPDYNATDVGQSDSDTQATITESLKPKLRIKDNPVLNGQLGEKIKLKE